MRLLQSAVLLVLAAGHAAAQPAAPWTDAPATLAAAVAPVEAELRGCVSAVPHRLAIIVARDRHGAPVVALPMPPVGVRGFTAEERCLAAAVARVVVPPLPPTIERLAIRYTIGAQPPIEPVAAPWHDPAAAIAAVIDPDRAALARCDARPRELRLIFDRRRGRTRVWLPAWQFHDRAGTGATPPRARRVKTCLTKVIRRWRPPLLPTTLGELHAVIAVTP